ncbi:MAG: type IV secretory system conjugative DNA transfer family protein [Candidatus Liptonbacteria bacterium]|nr:type IV secretory system conjugative DNA transfer family protein [Candidatus Liptonbacteria bacterium]
MTAAFVVVPVLLVVGIVVFAMRVAARRLLRNSLDIALLLVRIPQETSDAPGGAGSSQADFKAEIGRFEQLLANFSSFKRPFVLEVAVHHIGAEINFYVAVPRNYLEVAVKQIQGLWNGASVEPVPGDYTVFNPHGASAAAQLALKESFALPLRTYREIGSDTFASVLGGFTKINEVGEGAALQIVARPADRSAKKTVQEYVRALKRGTSLQETLGRPFPFKLSAVEEALRPEKREEEKKEQVVDEDAVKALEAKIAKPLFAVNVRVVASAPSAFQADDIVEGLTAGVSQLAAPLRNELKAVKPRNAAGLIHQFVFRTFDARHAVIVNSEEFASMYHFPTPHSETPRIKWLKSKEAPPPSRLPREGVLVGRSNFRGEVHPVNIADDDRRRHVYLVGQTGTGKSTLLGNMIVDDIRKGKGVAVIDPHGDLTEAVLGHIPRERVGDAIYFDPSDYFRPMGLNMLDYNFARPEEKTFIVNEMQGIFNKLFAQETMGPMFEQYMRNALFLLMEDISHEPATLIEVPRVFTDSEYRRRKLSRIKNPVVVDFWEKEAVKAGGEASLANMTPYITSKFNNFIANDYMRPIIGQPKSAFNFREVMDSGKILLVNLSKGRIGDINAGLLGMVVTGKLLMAALSRVDVREEARRDFYLYIDEFQNFTTDSISTILSEARKYRLNLTIAHQFIAQLTEKTRDAVFGNVGSQIVFRVGVTDAEFLTKQFEPTFSRNDLVNIDNFGAYAKILIHGETTKPFNIRTLPMPPGDHELATELKEYSRRKYGADREAVEADVWKRLRE